MFISFNSFNSLSTPQYNTFTLGSKTKLPKNRLLKNLVTDVVEISQKQEEMLPRKMEFSELEQKFNELLLKRDRVILNAMTQKQNLRLYYSSQDYYDYKELLKEKQRLNGQMRNLAKKADKKLLDMEFDMYTKRQYNRYAPKVYDTKNKEDLIKLQEMISSTDIFETVKEMLAKLIEQRFTSL